jgi:hypothetical protein
MYIVMEASAKMPSSVRCPYKRIAVIEIEDTVYPKMISPRAKGVRRIVRTWERLNVGRNVRSAYTVAKAEADELCDQLNKAEAAISAASARLSALLFYGTV